MIGFGRFAMTLRLIPFQRVYCERSGGAIANSECNSCHREFAESGEETLDLLYGVVVYKTDAQQPALRFDTQPFAKIQRVVVAVPGENAPLAEERGNGGRMVGSHAQRERRTAFGEAVRVGNAIDAHSGNHLKAADEARNQPPLVGDRCAVSGHKRLTPRFDRAVAPPPERGD